MKRSHTLVFATAFASSMTAKAPAQSLITNGDFDTEVPRSGVGGGWTISGDIDGSGGWQSSGGDPGANYILNDDGVGADPQIEQQVSFLNPPFQYELSGRFQSVYYNQHPADACCSFQIEFDGAVVFESGPGPLGEWRPFWALVSPSSTEAILKLRAEVASDNDFAVDSIRLALACRADTNLDGIIDNGDIITFINFIFAGDPRADMNGDGINDNGDIITFVSLFLAGCP